MNPKWLVDKPIAHRGFHNEECPENSVGAFERAIQERFPIELDVRLLKDGQVVVFHDYDLQRMTNKNQSVLQCCYDDIRDVTLAQTSEKIPLLKTVLEQVDNRVPLIIEIKNKRKAGKLELETYKLLKEYSGEYAIQSFNPFSVAWFKRHAPEVVRGQIIGKLIEEKSFTMRQNHLWNPLLFTKLTNPHFLNCDIFSYKYIPNHFKKNENMTLLGWTVKTASEYQKARSQFNNVVFEGFNPKEL